MLSLTNDQAFEIMTTLFDIGEKKKFKRNLNDPGGEAFRFLSINS